MAVLISRTFALFEFLQSIAISNTFEAKGFVYLQRIQTNEYRSAFLTAL